MNINVSSTTDAPETLAPPTGDGDAVSTEVKNDITPASEETPTEETTPLASDTEETETDDLQSDDGDDSSDESDSDDDENDSQDEVKPKGKKRSGFQRRINKMNAKVSKAEAEADYWRKEALKKASEPSINATPANVTSQRPDGKPSPDTFETQEDYIDSLTDWKLEQRDKKQAQARVQTEQENLVSKYRKDRDVFAEKTPDFHEVIESIDDVVLSPTLTGLFLESDLGPELVYELAQDRKEYERINRLTPMRAAVAIGKIEARIESRASNSETVKPIKKTNASTPIKPMRTKTSAVEKNIHNAENMSQREWEDAYKKSRKQA